MKDQSNSVNPNPSHQNQKNPAQPAADQNRETTGQNTKTAGNEQWNKGQETARKGNQNWDDKPQKTGATPANAQQKQQQHGEKEPVRDTLQQSKTGAGKGTTANPTSQQKTNQATGRTGNSEK